MIGTDLTILRAEHARDGGSGSVRAPPKRGAIENSADMRLAAIFTRREPASIKPVKAAPVYPAELAVSMKDEIDVMLMCGGSASDLPVQTPELARSFNVVDTFDTHAKIPEHFNAVDAAAKQAGTVAVISSGWDPGLFSLARMYAGAILPDGKDYTFWGKGVSQGHSDAVRRVKGVKNAKQYTIPVSEALDAVRSGKTEDYTPGQMHLRECFVVPCEGADTAQIEHDIVTMPNYFADYKTTVHFISEEEFNREHNSIPHGGFVLRSGNTGLDGANHHIIEYSLKLDSNPEFTAGVMLCCARAAMRIKNDGASGCRTMLDIPPAYLSPLSAEQLRKAVL